MKFLLLLGLMLGLAQSARLQVPKTDIYGSIFTNTCNGFAKRQDQSYVMFGERRISTQDPRVLPRTIFEATGANSSDLTWEFNESVAHVTSMADASGADFNATVGYTRLPNRADDEGYFIDVTKFPSLSETAVFWTGPGDDHPLRVLELQDHSYAVVGSTSFSAAKFSFVTRLLQRPDYQASFTRRIGNPSNNTSTLEEAVDVKQLPDGNLLVLGNTSQFSPNARPAPYLMKMGLDGAVLSFRTYVVDGQLQVWNARDMDILDNGTIVVVGSAIPLSTADTTGFIMQVSPDLTTVVGRQTFGVQSGTKTNGLTSVVAVPGTNEYYCAGFMAYQLSPTFKVRDQLIIRFNTTPAMISSMRTQDRRGQFNDITLSPNGTSVDAYGSTLFGSDDGTYMAGEKMLLQRFGPALANCDSANYPVTLGLHFLTSQAVSPQSSFVIMTFTGTVSLSRNGTKHGDHCATAKQAVADPGQMQPDPAAPEPSKPTLYPNPAGDRVTVALPPGAASAQIQVCDATGRLLQTRTTDQHRLELELAAFPKGLLLVRIQVGTQLSTIKLVHL